MTNSSASYNNERMRFLNDSMGARVFSAFSKPSDNCWLWFARAAGFVFFNCVIPFGILSVAPDLNRKEDEKRARNWMYALFFIVSTVSVLISFLSTNERIAAYSLWWLYAGWLINVLFLVPLYMSHKIQDYNSAVLFEVDLLRRNTENLVGDRLWSEGNTNSLLCSLLTDCHDSRAKWHVIKFLAHLADEHIRGSVNKGYFSLTTQTDGLWHLATYSRFLAANIDHAADEILWLVDPVDFCDDLVPDCMKYVLASIAIEILGRPVVSWGTDAELEKVFDPLKDGAKRASISSSDRDKVLALLAGLSGHVDLTNSSSEHLSWWTEFREKVLGTLVELGRLLLDGTTAQGNLSPVVAKGFQKLKGDWLVEAFPHIAALANCHAKRACRVIYVPHLTIKPEMNIPNESTVDSKRIMAFGHYVWKRLRERKYSDSEISVILPIALKLFAEATGGSNHISVFRSTETEAKEMGDKATLDFGLYDKSFAVRAQETTVGGHEKREVTWYYLRNLEEVNSIPEAEAQKAIKILLRIGDAVEVLPTTDGRKDSYALFVECMLACSPSAQSEG
jgi:hypothetical protein